jgi:hypothetical protein
VSRAAAAGGAHHPHRARVEPELGAADLALVAVQLRRRDEVGGQVGQRGEHEAPLPHAGVGDDQVGLVDHLVAHQEHVDVERAGRVGHGAQPPQRVLQAAGHVQQLPGPQVGGQLDDGVQVGR